VCTHTCTLDVVHINRFLYMYVYTYVFIHMHIYERHCVRWSSCCCGIFHNYCAALRSVTLRIDAHLRIHSAFLSDMVACVGCLHKHPFNHQKKTLISTMHRLEYPQRCKYATCAVRVRVRERRQRELISQRSGQPSSATVSTGMHGLTLHAKSQCLLSRREG